MVMKKYRSPKVSSSSLAKMSVYHKREKSFPSLALEFFQWTSFQLDRAVWVLLTLHRRKNARVQNRHISKTLSVCSACRLVKFADDNDGVLGGAPSKQARARWP
jgi:hypothetical protein